LYSISIANVDSKMNKFGVTRVVIYIKTKILVLIGW